MGRKESLCGGGKGVVVVGGRALQVNHPGKGPGWKDVRKAGEKGGEHRGMGSTTTLHKHTQLALH